MPRSSSPPESPQSPAGSEQASGFAAPRPLQFSMRSLLIFTTIATVATPLILAFAGAAPLANLLAGVFLVSIDLAVAVALGTAAVFSRGERRTFFGGACAAWWSASHYTAIYSQGVAWALGAKCVMLLPCVACGFVAIAVRRAAVRRGWNVPESSTPAEGSAGAPRTAAEEAVLRVLDV